METDLALAVVGVLLICVGKAAAPPVEPGTALRAEGGSLVVTLGVVLLVLGAASIQGLIRFT